MSLTLPLLIVAMLAGLVQTDEGATILKAAAPRTE
jgi:hypothetical protein